MKSATAHMSQTIKVVNYKTCVFELDDLQTYCMIFLKRNFSEIIKKIFQKRSKT